MLVQQKNLDPAARIFTTPQARPYHAGFVEREAIAFAKVITHVPEDVLLNRTRLAVDD
jgi:hypothetical protein